MLYHWKPVQPRTFSLPSMSDNMADVETCEVGITLAPLNIEP